LQKSDLINSFLKIEDDFFNSIIETYEYNKKIDDNRQITEGNEALFKSGILEKNIFDQDMNSVKIIMRKFVLLIFFLLNFVKFFFVEFCYFS